MTSRHETPCKDILCISAYVAGVLRDDARQEIEEHCASCEACRDRLVEAYRIGRATPENLAPADIDPACLDRAWRRVEAALEAWTREASPADATHSVARVIRLTPRIRRPARTETCALAAATEQTPPLSAITMAADNEEIMGKLGRAEGGGDLLLYLITENLSAIAGSRVTARDEETGSLAEGTPDDYGVVPLRDTASWNPTKMRVKVHLPG